MNASRLGHTTQIARPAHLAAMWLLAVLAACGPPAPKAVPPPPDPAPMEAAMFAASKAPGMVVVVVRKGDASVRGYGETAPGNGQRPGARSVFRLESVSKLFAADLLTDLAGESKLRLDDPLQTYAPAGVRVPAVDPARPITLMNLATHTSGLPRKAGSDAIAESPPARWQWGARLKGLSEPGRDLLYSNLAFDLLGDAIGAAAKEPYPEVLATRTSRPLGLIDTTPVPSAAECARLMQGEPGPHVDVCDDRSTTAASGGLYSTGADIAAYMQWRLALAGPPDPWRAQRNAIAYPRQALTKIEGIDIAGPAAGMGLGWVALAADASHPALLEKTGGGDGFNTYMALAPGSQIGVFVVVTRGKGTVWSGALAAYVNAIVGVLAGGGKPGA
ncbi:MAG: D-alanyl-D-alanine-carboxypeptidase/endopeptidase AmpH [Caulobacterales bacterium]